ncbi:MAG TPA: hypothetical protein VFD70_24110 [Anaerolineae bacterium]|nr:hypothetical protein [Anaerolineae bacterium]
MKRTILFALTLTFVGLFVVAAAAFAQGPGPTATPDPHHPTTMPGATATPTAQCGISGPGMLNGQGMMGAPNGSAGGMMSADMMQMMQMMNAMGSMAGSQSMMGGGGVMGGGMMGPDAMNRLPGAKPLTLDEAATRIQQYVTALNNADLKVADLEEYTWNFYGMVKETSTGKGAFQLIVDKYSGAVIPEMGPNMMWNAKYSPMAVMMGNVGMTITGDNMTLSADQAKEKAQTFLKAFLPTTTLVVPPDMFYGYYNFDVLRDGKPFGMLSVNGNTGAVWYHTWHGEYLGMKEIK